MAECGGFVHARSGTLPRLMASWADLAISWTLTSLIPTHTLAHVLVFD